MGIFSRLFSKKLDSVSKTDAEEILISGDIAPNLADEILGKLKASNNFKETLKECLLKYAKKLEKPFSIPSSKFSILIVGVNGSGKTTSIGKLAKQFSDGGRDVVIGACDTFRAAANEQLDIWADRAGAKIIHGTESAAVAYKTIESNIDIAILDTAGRLHNRTDLMDELAKIVRVVKKLDPNAPNEIWLVLDGTTGQNALAQIEFFNKVVPLTGLIVTKMDSTSKGGFLISYAAENALPVRYIGYGEKIDDLRPFNAEEYVNRLMKK